MPSSQALIETRPLPEGLTWPDGRRIAVVFNVAYEVWSEGARSGVGPMGNILAPEVFDPNAESYGRYNATAGSRRLLGILERHGLPASVLLSGKIAVDDPGAVKAIAAAGHDIVGHAYAQNLLGPTLTAEEDRKSIARSTEAIRAATGVAPRGWVSPRVTSTIESQRRLVEAGYAWHGDALDADLPYFQRFPEGEILVIPMSVEFNDLPHAMRFGRTPGQFVALFEEALAGIRKQPAETIVLDVFAHGHCYGRPAAAWAIDEIAARCAGDDTLWVTTRSEIARHCVNRKRSAA